MVMDTGADPNCVALKALPDGWKKFSTKSKAMPLRAANGQMIPTKGYVSLWVRFATYVARDEFLVCDSLTVAILLGAKYIYKHVKSIEPSDQVVTFKMENRSSSSGHRRRWNLRQLASGHS